VVREVVGAGGDMNQALYAHMNNKRKIKKNDFVLIQPTSLCLLIGELRPFTFTVIMKLK
jgi:hypothetical protein